MNRRRAELPGRLFPALPLALAGLGAALFHGRSYVGFYNDDASFVILAGRLWQALLSFSAADLSGAFSHFLPGYPAFLAPFAAALKPHWGLLRWTTAALSLASVYGLWRLLEGWLDEGGRRLAVLLYAAHPLFLMSSGLVMADPFLACLFVYGLLGLKLALAGRPAGAALLAACSLWAAAAKPIGIVLPAALTAALLAAGAWRQLRIAALGVWAPLLAAAGFAALRSGTPTDYTGYLLKGLASLAGHGLWERFYGLLHSFVLAYGLACPLPRGGWWDAAGLALIAGALWLAGRGLAALLKDGGNGRYLALGAGLLLLGQLLVMTVWTVYSERYALPMLPAWLVFLAAGAGTLPAAARPAVPAVLLAGFLGYGAWLAFLFNSERRPLDSRLPERTLAWINSRTPPAARFVGNGAMLFLYTGRLGQGLTGAADADLFLYHLYRSGVTHALVLDLPVLSTKGPYKTNHALQRVTETAWLRGRGRVFKKLYAEQAERTEVYEVLYPAGWEKGAGLYEDALRRLNSGDLKAGEAGLREALAACPDFPSALVSLANLRARGGAPAEAERLLRRALALEPRFERAARLLYGLLAARGSAKEAAAVRAAYEASGAPPFEAPSGL